MLVYSGLLEPIHTSWSDQREMTENPGMGEYGTRNLEPNTPQGSISQEATSTALGAASIYLISTIVPSHGVPHRIFDPLLSRLATLSRPHFTTTKTITMKFTAITAALTTLAAVIAPSTAAPLQARDVFVPKVLYPHAGTVWYHGQVCHNHGPVSPFL
jgi:hypothetical protein